MGWEGKDWVGGRKERHHSGGITWLDMAGTVMPDSGWG